RSENGEPSYGWFGQVSKLWPWDVPAAQDYIKAHPDHTAYHLLFAIRHDYPSVYSRISSSQKAAVLCDALTHTHGAGEWGYMAENYRELGDPAQALVETGHAALPFLGALLGDHSPVGIAGPGSGRAAARGLYYKYRIADFAHHYICLILGWEYVFHKDPKERDVEIERINKKLKEKEGKMVSLEWHLNCP